MLVLQHLIVQRGNDGLASFGILGAGTLKIFHLVLQRPDPL
jgi:hypothetical protein